MLGVRDKRIKMLRRRLEITGDLAETHQGESYEFDEALQLAFNIRP